MTVETETTETTETKTVKIGSLWLRLHDQRRYWIVSRVTKINNIMYNVTLLCMDESITLTLPVYHLLQSFKCISKCEQV